MSLRNRVAIVTGAGGGIGEAVAMRLAQAGAKVVIAEVNSTGGRRVEKAMLDCGTDGLFIETDVSVLGDVERLMETTFSRFGRLDILVNNAGVNFVKPTLEVSEAEWDHVLGVDLRGTFFCAQQALRLMLKARQGAIINIASVHATATIPGAAPYAAAKAGVVGLSRALAAEFGPFGIRINCVSPGATATQIWEDAQACAEDPEVFRSYWTRHTALEKIATPMEIAGVVVFLASEEAAYVSGANIVVDAGMTAMLTCRQEKPL
ncbi:MAG: glucose 1-dehydrogenase [Acidobacteriota bacterium]